MQYREYGRSGEKLSIIGFGGINVMSESQQEADRYVAEAIDRGINYFDVAPGYGDAQQKLGPALRGKRNQVFLACKTEKKKQDEVVLALEDSLRKLETDYFDLYQFHGVSSMEEAEAILAPGGALEAAVQAQKKGYIRYIGFSAHSEDAAIALMEQFDFASVLFPYNWVNLFQSGFGKKIMDKALEKGVVPLALKAMALTQWKDEDVRNYPKCWYKPIDDVALAALALRFTLSAPVAAAIPPGDIRPFRWAMDVGDAFQPLTPEEQAWLQEKSKEYLPLFPIQ